MFLEEAEAAVIKKHQMAGTTSEWFSREDGSLVHSAHGMYLWDGLKEHSTRELSKDGYSFFHIHDQTALMGFVVLKYDVGLRKLEVWKVKRPLDRTLWVPNEGWTRGFCSTALPIVIRDFVKEMKPKIDVISIDNDAEDDNVAACYCYINTFRTLGFTKVIVPAVSTLDSMMQKCLARDVLKEFRMRVSAVNPNWEIDESTDIDGLRILSKATIRFDTVPF
jgi:hypothetical protein